MADAEAAAGSDAPATLTVDLAATVENYRMLAAKAAPAECAGVVKADAYGLGAAKVAPALHRAGCRTFFVATLDEGRALRTLLPQVRIYVLDGLHGSDAAAFIADRLQPVLTSLEELERWRGSRGVEAGLHLDTGLSRLGMPADEAARLAGEPQRLEGITLTLAMSHLACADELAHPMNAEQLARFGATLDTLPLPKGITRSLAASSGVFLGAKYAFDLVRPGAALYGIEPLARQPNPLRQVVRLQAKSCRSGALTLVAPLAMVRPIVSTGRRGWRRSVSATRTVSCAPSRTGAAPISMGGAFRLSAASPWISPSSISADCPKARCGRACRSI